MERRMTFEAVASDYAVSRPGYPEALFADLEKMAGLDGRASVLEVGCGSGQATAGLATRASSVVAIDPGYRLLEEAKTRTLSANVTFVLSTFEDYDGDPGSFDLIASAQAWHWLDQQMAFGKAAALLRGDGSLAVFGHVPLPVDASLLPAFEHAFNSHVPGLWGSPPTQAGYLPTAPFPAMFENSGLFTLVAHRAYRWTWDLSPGMFGRYLRTDSGFTPIPESVRFALFDDLQAIVAESGAPMRWPWETHLYVGHKLR